MTTIDMEQVDKIIDYYEDLGLFTYVLKNTPDDVKRWEIGLADGGGTRYFRSDDDGIVMWLDGFAHGRGSALTSIL